jgi:hypothetical protein
LVVRLFREFATIFGLKQRYCTVSDMSIDNYNTQNEVSWIQTLKRCDVEGVRAARNSYSGRQEAVSMSAD